jgi:hypothetical protein
MTSPSFNFRRTAAKAEMAMFERLPKALQIAVSSAAVSVRSVTIWNALCRGVSEEKLLETIKAAGQKDKS